MEGRKLYFTEGMVEAGCDEAGRGCLAGPVVAAAVILPPHFDCEKVNDSKKLTAAQREEAAIYIRQNAICWAIGVVDNEEIDKINILKASIKAMHIAVDKLKKRPKLLLIDGNRFYPYKKLRHECIVDGDALYASIAAASILAKTHRDKLMAKLHKEFPVYNWLENKGYSTPAHKVAINEHGITPYHRRTYRPVNDYMQLDIFAETEAAEENAILL